METEWTCKDIEERVNPLFIKKADDLTPNLIRKVRKPNRFGFIQKEKVNYISPKDDFDNMIWKKGDSIVLDLGEHMVGMFSFCCDSSGSPPDAPGFMKITFCEVEEELWENSSSYEGWLSKAWLQEEWIHIDSYPNVIQMERRYACRYIKIDILDTSRKYRMVIKSAEFTQISSVDMEKVTTVVDEDEMITKIDKASIRTLQNCMQEVFEDGPKRDRRLWLGDLRLQALVNYDTFANTELVKRCLYLFAGLTTKEGMIAACVFHKPVYKMDDTFLLDYSLFFISVLLEYFEHTRDEETLNELKEIAFKQLEIASQYKDVRGIFEPEGEYHCFIDWNEELDKQCAMQAIYVYSIAKAVKLADACRDSEKKQQLLNEHEVEKALAYEAFFDTEKQVFISGEERQVSWASQVWMILAGVVDAKDGASLLDRVKNCPITMVSPYMNHYYMEALLRCGQYTRAKDHMKQYWGGMIERGADTFWELFNPQNPLESPYGSKQINSYCHAWSCTPAYFLRKGILTY